MIARGFPVKLKYRYLLIFPLLFVLAGCDGSGDRVLVAKFVYDSGLAPARRYDVVVFKYPKQPIENGTPKNYIKRLLGLPGEILAIFFGQLYTFARGDKLPDCITEEDWQKLTFTKVSPLDMWEFPPRNHETAQKLWDAKQFHILRKPWDVMLALSRPVFDNDHPAPDLVGVLPDRWAPRGGATWVPDTGHGFKATGANSAPSWLHYRHVLRPADWPAANDPDFRTRVEDIARRAHRPQLITDFMGYNTYESSRHTTPPPNWAGNLMLDCNVTVDEPKGEFWMELSKGIDRFQARLDLATGTCSLYRWSDHKMKKSVDNGKEKLEPDWQLLATAETRVKTKGTFRLRFANYDERLTVAVDRDLPFGDGTEYSPPALLGPDRDLNSAFTKSGNLDDITNNDLQPASLCSVGAAVQVRNLKLWRDTYYTGSAMEASDHKNAVTGDDWKNPDKWGPLRQLHPQTTYVYPGHYMCLGDNSPESSDSRHWGLVPERLMLGRALVVYFPFERAGTIK